MSAGVQLLYQFAYFLWHLALRHIQIAVYENIPCNILVTKETSLTWGMSKLVRYLSRRRTGKGIKRGVQTQEDHKKNKHVIVCTVVLLDGTDVTIELPVSFGII